MLRPSTEKIHSPCIQLLQQTIHRRPVEGALRAGGSRVVRGAAGPRTVVGAIQAAAVQAVLRRSEGVAVLGVAQVLEERVQLGQVVVEGSLVAGAAADAASGCPGRTVGAAVLPESGAAATGSGCLGFAVGTLKREGSDCNKYYSDFMFICHSYRL